MTSNNRGSDEPGPEPADPNVPGSTRTWQYPPTHPVPNPRAESWGGYPGPAGGYPAGPLPGTSSPGPSGPRRTVGGLAAVAVVAAVVGGGVGGYVGRHTAPESVSSVGTLQQPVPPAGGEAPGPVSSVAQRVLPSVVQLAGTSGEGSGVVLSADGLILTNAHVLDAGRLNAVFQDGTTVPVAEVGVDRRADLAVIRAQGVSGLTPIQLGNSDSLEVGEQVVAVGSPLGLAGTVTSGIVSSLNRPVLTGGPGRAGQLVPQTSVLDAIQTDAAINPGNSGGPLVDMQGRIVGLNSAIASIGSGVGGQAGSIGLGFAIPINQAKRIADELIRTGRATRAALGVTVRDGQPTGAQLVQIAPDGAAARAGLQPGDLVTKIGGRLVQNSDELVAAVNSAIPGSTVTLTVSSGGGPRSVDVTLGSVPADS